MNSTRRKLTNSTRNTTVTLLQGNGTVERGNASVTLMLRLIPSVRSATNKECWWRSKRCITKYPCQKAVHMTERTSYPFASLVTVRFMQREVTVGTEERVIHMNDGRDSRWQNIFILFSSDGRDSHFAKGRGRSNLCGSNSRATVPPLRVYFLRF